MPSEPATGNPEWTRQLHLAHSNSQSCSAGFDSSCLLAEQAIKIKKDIKGILCLGQEKTSIGLFGEICTNKGDTTVYIFMLALQMKRLQLHFVWLLSCILTRINNTKIVATFLNIFIMHHTPIVLFSREEKGNHSILKGHPEALIRNHPNNFREILMIEDLNKVQPMDPGKFALVVSINDCNQCSKRRLRVCSRWKLKLSTLRL